MICKLCGRKAVVEKGWINIGAILYPLCTEHMIEYWNFKAELLK